MHYKDKDTKSFTKQGKYLLNGCTSLACKEKRSKSMYMILHSFI